MNSMTVSISHILFIPSICGLVRNFKMDFSCFIREGALWLVQTVRTQPCSVSQSDQSPVSFKYVMSLKNLYRKT